MSGSSIPSGSANRVTTVLLHDVPIVCLWIDGQERLCLAQISNTLLKRFSYNEIHNRRVALGITCVQCTPVQLEILRRSGAMPVSSRRCGMISKHEAERLVKSFLEEVKPPKLPEGFAFSVRHECGWGCQGFFYPSRYNSSRAKCVKCKYCSIFFSANKFIFHYHRVAESKYRHPDAANFNSWRRHLLLDMEAPAENLMYAWEDVKAMFNGGGRKRMMSPEVKRRVFPKLQDPAATSLDMKSLKSLPRGLDGLEPGVYSNRPVDCSSQYMPLRHDMALGISRSFLPETLHLQQYLQTSTAPNHHTHHHHQPTLTPGGGDTALMSPLDLLWRGHKLQNHVAGLCAPLTKYTELSYQHQEMNGKAELPTAALGVGGVKADQVIASSGSMCRTYQQDSARCNKVQEEDGEGEVRAGSCGAVDRKLDIFRPYALDTRSSVSVGDVV